MLSKVGAKDLYSVSDELLRARKLTEELTTTVSSLTRDVEEASTREQNWKDKGSQIQVTYDDLLTQYGKLQAELRDAMTREDESTAELKRRKEAHRLLIEQQQDKELEDAVGRGRIEEWKLRVYELEEELKSREERFHGDIRTAKARVQKSEEREVIWVEKVSHAEDELRRIEREMEVIVDERENLRNRVDETELMIQEMESRWREMEFEQSAVDKLKAEISYWKIEAGKAVEWKDAVERLEEVVEEMGGVREKAEAEVRRFKEDLDRATVKSSTLEHEISRLNGSLKEVGIVRAEMAELRKYNRCHFVFAYLLISYVAKLESENGELRKGLREALERLQTVFEDEGWVDRRLTVDMVVGYISGGKEHDVLEIMSKVLQFTEEDRRKVGLDKVPNKGVLGSFKSLLTPTPLDEDKFLKKLEEKNLGDLWMDFLLDDEK